MGRCTTTAQQERRPTASDSSDDDGSSSGDGGTDGDGEVGSSADEDWTAAVAHRGDWAKARLLLGHEALAVGEDFVPMRRRPQW